MATIGLLYILQQSALTLFGPTPRPVEAPFTWRIQTPWFGYSGYKLFVVLAAGLCHLRLALGKLLLAMS